MTLLRHTWLPALIAVIALGCGDLDILTPTQTIVVVDAEDGVRGRADSLRVEVRSKDSQALLYNRTFARGEDTLKWPHTVALRPRDGDTKRQFEVTATATAANGDFVARASAISGYLPRQQLELRLMLEDACIGVSSCASGQTCRSGSCVDAYVDPNDLTGYDPNDVDTPVEVPPTDVPMNKDAGGEPVDLPDTSVPMDPDAGMQPGVTPGCTLNPDAENEVCPEICPEICNKKDDDCDRQVDEGDANELCDFAHAEGTCSDGVCDIKGCKDDYRDCDKDPTNGCEVAPDDIGNCGACGNVCAFEHATTLCVQGQCVQLACDKNFADCDSDRMQCETSLKTLSDCGSCGEQCSDFQHANATCVSGVCEPSSCHSGYGDCNADADDGCEQALTTETDCGACDASCDLPGSIADDCSSGSCVGGTCSMGYDDCDGDLTDGCESLASDDHCGACGVSCLVGLDNVASAACDSLEGECAIECEAGYGDCNADATDGCEASVKTLTHCSMCNYPCSIPNASATCGDGTCTFVACDDGWGDCDDNLENGCEQDLNADEHCGACDLDCTATASPYCSGRQCAGVECSEGTADCDSDGTTCETDITTSEEHCGGCGFVCQFTTGEPNATALSCQDSACAVTCADGFDDCNNDYRDGCEVSLATTDDCGACGTSCAIPNAEETCATGTCEIVECDPDYGDCDLDGNSCEVKLDTTSDCGGCDVQCALANAVSTCGGSEGTRACAVSVCNQGYANCDDVDANGCETNIYAPADCGGCASEAQNQACQNLPNVAQTGCPAGSCQIQQCAADWVDCDGNVANGCEQQLSVVGPCFPDTNCTKQVYDGRNYFFCTNARTWSEARTLCELQLLGDLARIDDSAENTFVKGQLTADAWLGGNDQMTEGQFRWADNSVQFWQGTSTGSSVGGLFGKWATGEPNDAGGTEDCVSMLGAGLSAGFWNDVSCTTAYGFVCEVQGDLCPSDASKTDPGQCGCGMPDTDGDGDGTANCLDDCPSDPLKVADGMCGCGVADTDSDMDLSPDCMDMCDGDPLKTAPGTCGCGVVDSATDTDGDAVPDCIDACPMDDTRSTAPCGDWTSVSNFDPATIDFNAAPTATLSCGTTVVDTSTTPATITNWCGTAPVPVVRTQASGPDVVVLPLRGLTVNQGQTLRLIGTRPVILAVDGPVNIAGTVDASGSATTSGAGAGYMCGSSAGAGGAGTSAQGAGGGGGGYGTAGGKGGNSSLIGGSAGGAGGVVRGSATLTPLVGGCGGGDGGGCTATGARGGGGLQISTTGTLTLAATATVAARGGAGSAGCTTNGGGGGGGSGGAILLEASVIKNFNSAIVASGGTGGDGAGTVGGDGGAGSTAASGAGTAGSNGSSFVINGGGGGGGGGYGRIRMRTIGDGGRTFANWTASNFTPQSYTYVRDVLINCNATFSSSGTPSFTTWCSGTQPTPVVVSQSGGPDVVVIPMKSFTVEAGFALRVIGTRPVIFAVDGDIAVYGTIDAAATLATAGAGGNSSCGAGTGTGGNGSHDTSNDDGSGGGGGGGGAAVGGGGGSGHSADQGGPGAAGVAVANSTLIPLRGGCPGGNGGGSGATGGAGGGGIQLSARTLLFMSGVIDVSGGGGQAGNNAEDGGGGGGAAGNILLEGDSYQVSGVLRATGGGGARGNRSTSVTGIDGTDGRSGGQGSTSSQGGGGGGAGGAAGNPGSTGTNGAAYSYTTTDGMGNNILVTENGAGGGGGGGSGGRIVQNATAP